MQVDQKQALQKALAALASTHAVVVEQIELAIQLLTEAIESEEGEASIHDSRPGYRQRPVADRKTLTIYWQGSSCFLGNTLLFWFFDRISQSPNQYVTYSDLLDDVWGGPRENSTIRGVAKRLRDRLAADGMHQLAASIDGSVSGYYGLMLVASNV